jgi:hypothetical protein
MARAEDALFDFPDPFEDVQWAGWARFGRGQGCKYHRVRLAHEPAPGETQRGYVPLCGCRQDPMPPRVELLDYRWDPGRLDRCFDCWPEGVPHPGIISDLPPDKRYR